jgi:phosphatidylserine/phosphatidylglycerophosphate/cardiolipin synthase-like enzyme
MNPKILTFLFLLQGAMLPANGTSPQKPEDRSEKTGPEISNLTYDNITTTSVTVYWKTDLPADSKIRWMAPDSNYQALIFIDSLYISALVTNHAIPVSNLQPATIYKYQVISQNADAAAVDSGYFVTQSASSGKVNVYFNHTVDISVSTGEHANGSQNFENLFISRIDSAKYSIDITLWGFSYYTSITNALINAKNRGVKIRFVYNHTAFTPWIDSLIAHEIPVIKREFDTIFSMHNKFLIFDYRYNDNPKTKYLWTGSTNVSHPQFHSDKNNIIVIQDEALCAVYTREFEEMWGSHTDLPDPSKARFGTQKTDNVPHILNVAGTRMEVYFSPSDSVSAFLSNLILTKTTESLFFCMLKFELPEIENALHTIFIDEIKIKGVFDLSNIFLPNSAYPRMKGMAVPNAWNPHADVFPDTLSGLIHHKYFITDANSSGGNKITATGSFNWETPANIGNDENSLIIFDARVNNLYYQEFHSRYRESGGELIGLGIGNPDIEINSGFSLSQNYPNPFNASTNIKFTIANSGDVKIIVYDMIGRQVKTLANEKLKPGTYEISFDGSSLPNGIYLYRFSVADFTQTRRMILDK